MYVFALAPFIYARCAANTYAKIVHLLKKTIWNTGEIVKRVRALCVLQNIQKRKKITMPRDTAAGFLPCPFCGEKVNVLNNSPIGIRGMNHKSRTTVSCYPCRLAIHASTPTQRGSLKKMKRIWNTRKE